MSSGSSSAISDNEIMSRVRLQIQEQQMEQLVENLTAKCFEKCVKKPGSSLTSGEQNCIAKAMDRYMEVMNLIFFTVAKKAES